MVLMIDIGCQQLILNKFIYFSKSLCVSPLQTPTRVDDGGVIMDQIILLIACQSAIGHRRTGSYFPGNFLRTHFFSSFLTSSSNYCQLMRRTCLIQQVIQASAFFFYTAIKVICQRLITENCRIWVSQSSMGEANQSWLINSGAVVIKSLFVWIVWQPQTFK